MTTIDQYVNFKHNNTSTTLATNYQNPSTDSDLDIMELTPLLLARRITELIRPTMCPDILRNFLPRHLRRLHRIQRRRGRALGKDVDSLAKKSSLT